MSAAPASVAGRATIMDGEHRVLRPGDNGWICLPDDPSIANNSPMCLDAQWLDFIGLPTNPGSTGPWVMWKGTPYAHLMIPMERAGIANAPR